MQYNMAVDWEDPHNYSIQAIFHKGHVGHPLSALDKPKNNQTKTNRSGNKASKALVVDLYL